MDGKESYGLEGVCEQLSLSKDQLETGFCEFLNASDVDWEDLQHVKPLGCLENITELVLDEQMVRCPGERDVYRVLHEYLWTLKVIETGLDEAYPGDAETLKYILDSCFPLNSAVYEFFQAVGGSEGNELECDLNDWMAECEFQCPGFQPHPSDSDKATSSPFLREASLDQVLENLECLRWHGAQVTTNGIDLQRRRRALSSSTHIRTCSTAYPTRAVTKVSVEQSCVNFSPHCPPRDPTFGDAVHTHHSYHVGVMDGKESYGLEGVCEQLSLSKDQLETGFCEFLNASDVDWEDLQHVKPLGCLENITELVLDEQMVRCPGERDVYRVLHEYLWTLKVIETGLDEAYPGDAETLKYILDSCFPLNSAVYEFFQAVGGSEGNELECDLNDWMAECEFQCPGFQPHPSDSDKATSSPILREASSDQVLENLECLRWHGAQVTTNGIDLQRHRATIEEARMEACGAVGKRIAMAIPVLLGVAIYLHKEDPSYLAVLYRIPGMEQLARFWAGGEETWEKSPGGPPPAGRGQQWADGEGGDGYLRDLLFAPEELAKYNGRKKKELYLAILGRVYDVSSARNYYGKGGFYEPFTGRDASRAFLTGDFSEGGLTDEVSGLTDEDYRALDEQADFYDSKYKYVGEYLLFPSS
ncbi:unnamed protein product [Darwinula stevensoni]|uniref:Cytochrome b5 heme-binding domain-containing protein n=1 Tax=Darwinula stevensoni TaxID=69355 RepID=A0A7R9ACW8_9CRUS|nr:unnamed protein product [Darwinula stevensoni]CAG0900212.1 unnamed protein product [Darwinula stevensoni]